MTSHGGRRAHYAWVILGGTAVTLLAASGVRNAFGVFIQPMDRPVPRRPPTAVAVAAAPSV